MRMGRETSKLPGKTYGKGGKACLLQKNSKPTKKKREKTAESTPIFLEDN